MLTSFVELISKTILDIVNKGLFQNLLD